jgi:thiamine biosynthesis lipoprotein
MKNGPVSRRRFIGIAGAVAGLAAWPPPTAEAVATMHRWSGVALGARASIQLVHPDPREAARVIDLAVQEIQRLEQVFSLYLTDSAVSRLNRTGRLAAPPLELVDLLTRAAAVSAESDGAFDVTIQPLWRRYWEHFLAAGSVTGPPVVADALRLVDWRAVKIDAGEIAFDRTGMAITPNGIAQGYITDRVVEVLHRNGIAQTAVDLGEARTMGRRPDGRGWVIGVSDPASPKRIAGRVDGSDRAVATSGGYGTVFDREGRYSHLLDPRTGRTAAADRGVTVVAAEACLADAWSTACALMDAAEIRVRSRQLGGVEVYVAGPRSSFTRLV